MRRSNQSETGYVASGTSKVPPMDMLKLPPLPVM